MPKDSAQADDLSWFYDLPMDARSALQTDPRGPLSERLVDLLRAQPVVTETPRWAGTNDPLDKILSAPVALRLSAIRSQLDDWWETVAHLVRLHLIEKRGVELDETYIDMVQPAADALGEELLRDPGSGRFRLPPMIRVYVEMKATSGAQRRRETPDDRARRVRGHHAPRRRRRVRQTRPPRRRISVHRNAVNVGGQVVVGTPKTHAERTVVFPKFLIKPLSAVCAGKGRDSVMFPNRFGHYATPPGVSTWFSGAVGRCMKADQKFPG